MAGAGEINISSESWRLRSTGRIWGDVVTTNFSSEDGAFLRGQMRMEDKVEITDTGSDPHSEALENQPIEPASEEE